MCAGTLDSIGLVRFFELLEQSAPRPTWYSAVPTMHQMIVSYSQSRPLGDHSIGLVRNCSAALLPTVARALEAVFMGRREVRVLATYAMSESMPICSNPRFGGVRKLESVGPAAGPRIVILAAHPSTAAVTRGSEGEVCVAGLCVTSGYEQRSGRPDPNESAFVLTEEGRYLRTGDKALKTF
jgi:acyl-CoA synthetase (AMP-forming)/AMP-acid ligase II